MLLTGPLKDPLQVLPDGVAELKCMKLLDVRNNDLSNLPPKLSLIEAIAPSLHLTHLVSCCGCEACC